MKEKEVESIRTDLEGERKQLRVLEQRLKKQEVTLREMQVQVESFKREAEEDKRRGMESLAVEQASLEKATQVGRQRMQKVSVESSLKCLSAFNFKKYFFRCT